MHSLIMIIIYGYITNSQNDQLPDDLIAQLIEDCIGIADVKIWHPSKFHFRGPSLKSYKECDMSLRDVHTIHNSNMLARDSVICSFRPLRWLTLTCLQAHLYILEGRT